MREKVENILIELKQELIEQIKSERFISDGLLDSLDIMNLIMALEDAFDIEIDPEDVLSENFESVDKIVELINKCKAI